MLEVDDPMAADWEEAAMDGAKDHGKERNLVRSIKWGR
jgi:hypothetical protein